MSTTSMTTTLCCSCCSLIVHHSTSVSTVSHDFVCMIRKCRREDLLFGVYEDHDHQKNEVEEMAMLLLLAGPPKALNPLLSPTSSNRGRHGARKKECMCIYLWYPPTSGQVHCAISRYQNRFFPDFKFPDCQTRGFPDFQISELEVFQIFKFPN